MSTATLPAARTSRTHRPWARRVGLGVLWTVLGGLTLWAAGALWFDFPVRTIRQPVAVIYAAGIIAVAVLGMGRWRAMGLIAGAFIALLVWWLTLRPSNDRAWQPDVAETPWAEVDGDRVTLHNVRNCEYRTATDFTPRWETRAVHLAQLTGLDLAIDYWGSEWMAHPIASFQFADAPPVCFSIETRKEVGERYSTIGGFYRQFELVYVCADERDVLRVRTNFRKGEDVFLYRTTVSPAAARQRFIEYIAAMNALHDEPRWYNAATTNCTTSIRTQHVTTERAAWDWRVLLNGYADEMLYERGVFAGGLQFPELKARARINEAARDANDAADFSQRIRAGRPGFDSSSTAKPASASERTRGEHSDSLRRRGAAKVERVWHDPLARGEAAPLPEHWWPRRGGAKNRVSPPKRVA
jgi:Domain of unknown function (DUF4105)